MSGFFQNLQNEDAGAFSSGNPYLRDYRHASKTFRTNSYQRAPKLKFLFHTYFEINIDVTDSNTLGLLVKEIKLPTYGFSTTQLNQYNRKRIIQTKIKYEPIEISFHDDGASQATKLWEKYYTYYYNDATKPGSVLSGARGGPAGAGSKDYNSRNIYDSSISGNDDWGYIGGASRMPFFKNITVFGFNQHEFTAYTLINPIITSFSHDSYNYSEGSGTMTNRMTIDYETVVYNYGSMDGNDPGNIVTGFGDVAYYDREPSTITFPKSNSDALGNGGLVPASGGFINSPNAGNPAGAAIAAGDAYNSFANPKLNVAIPNLLNSGLTTSLQNNPSNRPGLWSYDTFGASPALSGTAGGPVLAPSRIAPQNIDPNIVTAGTQYRGPNPLGFTGTPPAPPFNPGD